MTRASDPLRVLVVGGGFAAAETVLALRAYARDRVDIELVAPESRFFFRPAATAAPFTDVAVQSFELAALAEQTGTTLLRDRVEAVAPSVKRIRLASGAQRGYDMLVLTLGARARAAVPGAVTFRDQRDVAQLQRIVQELRSGALDALALTVPAGVSWTLPVYELALLAAAEVKRLRLDTTISLVTPEPAALAVFGANISAPVEAMLAAKDVRLICATIPRDVDRRGLRLIDGGQILANRVIAAPALVGQPVTGVPTDSNGFVPTGPRGRVEGLEDVYAAGDTTTSPVKQGGLATQQADMIAAVIARRAGASPPTPPLTPVLRAQLFGAPEPIFLEATLDERGQPIEGRSHLLSEAPWWPRGTLFGRHLTAWMAQQTLTSA
jgi:sulfide:quinone oxidoreductase